MTTSHSYTTQCTVAPHLLLLLVAGGRICATYRRLTLACVVNTSEIKAEVDWETATYHWLMLACVEDVPEIKAEVNWEED